MGKSMYKKMSLFIAIVLSMALTILPAMAAPTEITLVSDTNTEYSLTGTPGSWSPCATVSQLSGWPSIPSGATWIWRIHDPDPSNSPGGEYYEVPDGGWFFQRVFTIPDVPISGSIWITADNAYRLYINGNLVGGQDNTKCGFMSKDGPDATPHAWESPEEYVISSYLHVGENTILIRAINYFDWGGSFMGNPCGLAYKATIRCGQNGVPELSFEATIATAISLAAISILKRKK